MIDDRGRQIDLAEKEKDPMGRFEILAERYMNGSEKEREIILSFFPEPAERKILMEGFGLYHLFRDQRLYKSVEQALAEQMWQEAHQDQQAKLKGTGRWSYVRLRHPKDAGPLEQITVSYRDPVRNFTGFRDDPRVLAAVKEKEAGQCQVLVWREVVEEV